MPLIAQVALDTPVDRLFDYGLPDNLQHVQTGSLVEVPFGRKRLVGVVMHVANASSISPDKLRRVEGHLADRPALPPHLIQLAQFCADYYHYPLGPILLSVLPPRLRDPLPFSAAAPWLCLTEVGLSVEPPLRAHAQRKLLTVLRAVRCQHRDVIRQHGQSRHAAALVQAGWARWQSTGAKDTASGHPCSLPETTKEQQQALDAVKRALENVAA